MGVMYSPFITPNTSPTHTHSQVRAQTPTHTLTGRAIPPARPDSLAFRAREGFSVTGEKTKKILAGHVEKRKRENWG